MRMEELSLSFKPYYNWNTFNTPSPLILNSLIICFKPYYNWNTFNTLLKFKNLYRNRVLNLIITGIPSILGGFNMIKFKKGVLNLIITGIPSIHEVEKVYDKWSNVLNLIITGIPSIP